MGWSDFVKIKKIGEGSFGAAWLVKSNKDNKQYVIKLINVSRMPTKERDEARKEVSVLAQMKHPNIVSYIDSFEEAGNLCIVMDYCDGGDLYSKIHSTRGVHFNEDQILDWFVQITLALKHVHDRKILHRDLKSQNIFLTKDGVVKLGDFGVAKVLSNTCDFARTAIGTPYYMSPELVEHKPYNNKSDVWSLGCVLYELANMKHPFEANNMQMLAYKILRGNFDPISPKFSYELRNLVTSMLKRNPRERPSVNGILRKAFVMKRCEKFLTNDVLVEEFSHTVLHGENFMRKIQNINQPKPVIKLAPSPSPRPISAVSAVVPSINKQLNAQPSPKQPAYDPSKIYNAPVVRRSNQGQLKKSIEKRNQIYLEQKAKEKKQAAAPSVDYSEMDRKSPYLDQLKNKRAFEEALLKKKQQEISDRQKLERLKKAGEQGWKNVLHDSEAEIKIEENNNNNIYAYRHQQLDELIEKKKLLEKKLDQNNNAAVLLKPSPTPPVVSRQNSNNNNLNNIKNAKTPAFKNSFSREYKRRKEEFERNRARGKAINNNIFIAKPPLVKKDEKSVYEENLRKIRLNNYNNRKVINNSNKSKDLDEPLDENPRMERLAALKQQAEEQRIKFKNDLEKRRIEANERERKLNADLDLFNVIKPQNDYKSPRVQVAAAAPPANLTEVFNAIGIVGKQISKAEVLKNPDEKIRKSWQKATDLHSLDNKTLIQQTCVKNNPLTKYKPPVSPRKVWDLPHETILKAFEMIAISPNNSSSTESEKSGIQTILMNEKEPEFQRTKLVLSPEKLATLKATKNLLLGVTFGQFDPKSTNMLRTCSEPDMTKLFQINEVEVKSNEQKDDTKSTLKKFSKSLEDLTEIDFKLLEEDLNNEDSSETNSEEKDCIEAYQSTIKNELNESLSSNEDVTEVRETMELFLLADNKEKDKEKKPKKSNVCFASKNRLVTAHSVNNYEFTADSLDPTTQSLIHDQDDCEEASIDSDSDDNSDTEFEDDDVVIPKNEIISSFSETEEKRLNLEKNLGEKKFIDSYPLIERLILDELKARNNSSIKNRKSFILFKEIFPDDNENLYELFRDVIIADNEN